MQTQRRGKTYDLRITAGEYQKGFVCTVLYDIQDEGNKKASNWPLGISGNGKNSNKNRLY